MARGRLATRKNPFPRPAFESANLAATPDILNRERVASRRHPLRIRQSFQASTGACVLRHILCDEAGHMHPHRCAEHLARTEACVSHMTVACRHTSRALIVAYDRAAFRGRRYQITT